MARNTRNVSTHRAGYVNGSAARKLNTAQAAPQVEKRRRIETEEERRERLLKEQNIRRANHMNFVYTLAVIGVTLVIFGICCQYLQSQATAKAKAAQVASLQSQLTELTTANDELEVRINAGIDYEAIYNSAINDLGMVHPKKSQVITFDAGESEYVKQFSEIPKAE
ncbi:MAG: hypothetical protein IJB96_04645 [Lachnospira sp.]|nr:hypothetical protein [Lachnospira sp.]